MITSVATHAERAEALRWLARQQQWERILDHLRRRAAGAEDEDWEAPRAA